MPHLVGSPHLTGGAGVTAILDHEHAAVAKFAETLKYTFVYMTDMWTALRIADDAILEEIRNSSSSNEHRTASRTLLARKGSASQRQALLEAVARRWGTATRTHLIKASDVSGSRTQPKPQLLLWPEFELHDWVPLHEILVARGRSLINIETNTSNALRAYLTHGQAATGNLHVESLGYFDSRDEALASVGGQRGAKSLASVARLLPDMHVHNGARESLNWLTRSVRASH